MQPDEIVDRTSVTEDHMEYGSEEYALWVKARYEADMENLKARNKRIKDRKDKDPSSTDVFARRVGSGATATSVAGSHVD